MRGSIVRRKDKYYVITELPRDEDGKRRQKWHSGYSSRREAERALSKLQVEIDEGRYVAPGTKTLAQFVRDDWLPATSVRVRPLTLKHYREQLERYALPELGHLRLDKLEPLMLTKHYAMLLKRPKGRGVGNLSPRTVRYTHVVLKRALQDAVVWRMLGHNPCIGAQPPSEAAARPPEMQTWSLEELHEFLRGTEGDRDHIGYVLAATCGLRRGEVCGLRWTDLDLTPRTGPPHLQVRQQLVMLGNTPTLSAPKTAASRRRVALDPGTVDLLERHRLQQKIERLACGPAWQESRLVVARPDGGPVNPTDWARRFYKQVRRLGLPKIRFHDLRHTHATLALQAGIHPKIMSERLGHTSTAFTLDIYSHAVPTLQGEAALAVGALVLGPRSAG